jgi:hypothetical protein
MRKNPLEIILSLVHNLNLLKENKEYNINEFKELCKLDIHWRTIKRYLKIISIIQNYSPRIRIDDTRFHIRFSGFYNSLNEKERVVLYLYQKRALTLEDAVKIPKRYKKSLIEDSIGYLFKEKNNKFYLTKIGVELYNATNSKVSERILKAEETTPLWESFFSLQESDKYITTFSDTGYHEFLLDGTTSDIKYENIYDER